MSNCITAALRGPLFIFFTWLLAQPAFAAEAKLSYPLSLPAGSLAQAVDSLAAHFHLNILYQPSTLKTLQQAGIRGTFSAEQGLQALLAGSPVYAERVDASTFIIKPAILTETDHKLAAKPTKRPHIDEIIVTGSRQKDRTLFTSLSPVDVINAPMAVGSVEMVDSLATQLPGYTAFRLPLSDGQIFNRTSGLRGLNSDHTLVLVNGKRRHRSAFLETSDGQPTDLTHIPMYAVERIEVLRDGASAMYGSDAIAGVINVILDNTRTTSIAAQTGQYYAGDGQSYALNIHHGWGTEAISGGAITLSMYTDQPTSRSEQPADAIVFSQNHPDVPIANPVQRWGQPRRKGLQMAYNFEHVLSEQDSLYSFGTASKSQGSSDFNWRNPDTNKLFSPTPTFPDFDLRDWFEAGFTPSFGQHELDLSMVGGLRLQRSNHSVDISVTAGQNQIRYFIDNTVNASLGPASPTSFHPGTLRQQEFSLDVDHVVQASNILNRVATLASGFALRQERYTIIPGDTASWAIGPAVLDGLPAGANGFPGYSPNQAGTFKQTSGAAYINLSLPITTGLDTDIALRYENYSQFSDILRGKLSARYEVNKYLMIRSTLSNGFRAPTAGQMYSERTSQGLNAEFNGVSTSGRLSPLSPVAEVLSRRDNVTISPLKPERSINIGAGIGIKTQGGASLNIDWYRIDLTDRFGTTPVYEPTTTEQIELSEDRYNLDYPVDTVNFFQNLYDTRTQGIDVVAYLPFEWHRFRLLLTGAMNINITEITGGGLASNPSQKRLQERSLPRTRAQLALTWQAEQYDLKLGWRYIDSWQDLTTPGGSEFQTFSPIHFFDLSANWYVTPAITLKMGIENLLNRYPDRASLQANRGLKYSRNSPYDTDGGLTYLRAVYRF